MFNFHAPRFAIVAVVLFAAAAPVRAAIVNPSFETPVLTDNAFQIATPAGWSYSGNSTRLTFNPNATNYPAAAGNTGPVPGTGDGFQIFRIFGAGELTQVLADTFAANTIYTLTVAHGYAASLPPSYNGIKLQVLSGLTVVAEAIGNTAPPVGTFVDISTTLTGNPYTVGGAITIKVFALGNVASSYTDLDNVRLSAVAAPLAVPAPAAMPAGLALLALAAIRRRRAA